MTDDKTTSNVKIYDRPDKKAPSPILMVIILLVVLALGFFAYRTFFHHDDAAPPTENTRPVPAGKAAASP